MGQSNAKISGGQQLNAITITHCSRPLDLDVRKQIMHYFLTGIRQKETS
jgi:hypothetical protein